MGMNMQRTESMDSNNLGAFPSYGLPNPLFNPASVQLPPINLQQLQYQQSLLARAAPPMSSFYPNMQSGFGAFSSPSPAGDNFRNQAAPIQPPQQQMSPGPLLQSSFGPPGFGNIGMGLGGYGYAGMGMPGMGYGMQQEQQVNGRRGRVR